MAGTKEWGGEKAGEEVLPPPQSLQSPMKWAARLRVKAPPPPSKSQGPTFGLLHKQGLSFTLCR